MLATFKKPIFWLGRRIRSFLAIDGGVQFAKTLPRPRNLFSEHKEQLRENLDREATLARYEDFTKVLQEWGIISEEDLTRAIKERRQMRRVGIFLLCFGLGLDIWQTFFLKQSLYWLTLQGFFDLSLALLGGFMILACTWRIQVLTKRRFVPFLEWLRRKGRV